MNTTSCYPVEWRDRRFMTEKADGEISEILGPYRRFAEAFRFLIGWSPGSPHPRMSTRQAARKIGTNHVTVSNTANGDRPAESTVRKIARAFDQDVDAMLKLAGYIDPDSAVSPSVIYDIDPDLLSQAAEALEGTADAGNRELAGRLKTAAGKVKKRMTAAEAYLEGDREGSIGRRASDEE